MKVLWAKGNARHLYLEIDKNVCLIKESQSIVIVRIWRSSNHQWLRHKLMELPFFGHPFYLLKLILILGKCIKPIKRGVKSSFINFWRNRWWNVKEALLLQAKLHLKIQIHNYKNANKTHLTEALWFLKRL